MWPAPWGLERLSRCACRCTIGRGAHAAGVQPPVRLGPKAARLRELRCGRGKISFGEPPKGARQRRALPEKYKPLVRPQQFRFAASVSSAYRIASPFLIRLAGIPFDVLEQLATPKVCAAARDLLAQEKEIHQIKSTALEFVTRRNSGLSSEEFAAWRIAIRRDKIPEQKIPQPLEEYTRVATTARQARSQLEHQLQEELTQARRALLQTSQRILP